MPPRRRGRGLVLALAAAALSAAAAAAASRRSAAAAAPPPWAAGLSRRRGRFGAPPPPPPPPPPLPLLPLLAGLRGGSSARRSPPPSSASPSTNETGTAREEPPIFPPPLGAPGGSSSSSAAPGSSPVREASAPAFLAAPAAGAGCGEGEEGAVAVTREYLWSVLDSVLGAPGDAPSSSADAGLLEAAVLKAVAGSVPGMSRGQALTLLAETCASLATRGLLYGEAAARVAHLNLLEGTPGTFGEAADLLRDVLDPGLYRFIKRNERVLNSWASSPPSDGSAAPACGWTYLGLCTLQKSYLLRHPGTGRVVERPRYLYLRVALGIHYSARARDSSTASGDRGTGPGTDDDDEEEEAGRRDARVLEDALETYRLLSGGVMTHASPTLFHAGTRRAQLSSCFLLQMEDDSIRGIYGTLGRCAVVSKGAGGIGLAVSKIRARGTRIAGTGGVSNGLVPMLRVYDATCRYVDQGGGKRPGAFAVYVEPWHADVFDVLALKKNHGKEEHRARDLFYGLWIPDLFMERVYRDEKWSLFCPHRCPGLHEVHGSEFQELYERYEQEGRASRQVRARDLWAAVLESQIETGTPYMCYKDACNAKSNQRHLGTISSSNLCTEIVQYTSPDEVAVCNLASLCLSRFVRARDDESPYGSPFALSAVDGGDGCSEGGRWFDHAALHRAVKTVTRNLNKIIDINQYPIPESEVSNRLHRPVGIGVSGLADAFVRLGYAFGSAPARQLNRAIFETMYHAALEASAELAERDGWYPSFPGSPTSQGLLQHHLWGMADDETPSRRYFADLSRAESGRHGYDDRVASQGGYDWEGLRRRIRQTGLRNSLLLAPMPTASTSQILGVNECFEPFSSNLYIRRVKAGEFIYANPHLLSDLTALGLWTPSVRNQLMRDGGSVQNIAEIPQKIKDLYRTVWEISMRDVIDMAADRGRFVDQSQSLNLFMADPTLDKLTAMHFYAWKQGLKTGMYYLRTKPAVSAIQYTVHKEDDDVDLPSDVLQSGAAILGEDVCTSCSA